MMNDHIIRAIAAEGQIRAFAATTRECVEAARTAHDTSPVVTAALGRLLTAGAMMGSMMKGEKDVLTLQIRSDGPVGGLTVTANAAADVKGYAIHPQVLLHARADGKLDVGGAVGKGSLRVIKDMGLKEPYNGQVALQTGEIADDLTYYFAASEQVPSSVGLGVLMEKDNTVKQAGGFIVQLMPSASEETVSRLEESLSRMTSVTELLEEGNGPEGLLSALLGSLGIEILDTVPTRFCCDCDRKRVEKVIISIGAEEIQDMIDEGKDTEVSCQFCGRSYLFTPEEMTEIRRKAVRR